MTGCHASAGTCFYALIGVTVFTLETAVEVHDSFDAKDLVRRQRINLFGMFLVSYHCNKSLIVTQAIAA